MLGLEGNTKKDFMGSYEKDWHVTKTPFNIIWGGRNERYNNIPYGQEERIIDKPKIDKYKIVLGSQLKIENNIWSTIHSTRIFHCSCTHFYTFMIYSLNRKQCLFSKASNTIAILTFSIPMIFLLSCYMNFIIQERPVKLFIKGNVKAFQANEGRQTNDNPN